MVVWEPSPAGGDPVRWGSPTRAAAGPGAEPVGDPVSGAAPARRAADVGSDACSSTWSAGESQRETSADLALLMSLVSSLRSAAAERSGGVQGGGWRGDSPGAERPEPHPKLSTASRAIVPHGNMPKKPPANMQCSGSRSWRTRWTCWKSFINAADGEKDMLLFSILNGVAMPQFDYLKTSIKQRAVLCSRWRMPAA